MSISDKFTIRVRGQEREITMFYGLLQKCMNELAVSTGEPVDIMQQPGAQERVLKLVLAKYTPEGKTAETVDLDDFELNVDETSNLLAWVTEHVIDFFLKGLDHVKRITDTRKDRLESLTPSSIGTED